MTKTNSVRKTKNNDKDKYNKRKTNPVCVLDWWSFQGGVSEARILASPGDSFEVIQNIWILASGG